MKLDWPGFVNARSLGGMPVTGGVIREGALFRSDRPGLHADTSETVAALERAGVEVVVDLRGGPEGDDVDVLRDHPGRTRIPIVDAFGADVETQATTQGDVYLDILRDAGGALARAVATIASAPPGGVLVHCTAGKDRTGLVIALVLTLLGASRDDVCDDYAATRANLAPFHDAWVASLAPGAFRDRVTASDHNAPRAAMEQVLDWLQSQGGAAAWLARQGLPEGTAEVLRRRLVDEG